MAAIGKIKGQKILQITLDKIKRCVYYTGI
jgi:hypothetical protein